MTVAIILPAFNERQSLPSLVRLIDTTMQGAGLEHMTILVDDGSDDGTADAVPDHVHMLHHAENRGLGAALETGFQQAMQVATGVSAIVTLDADNTHPPAIIPRLVDAIRGDHDVAIASRYVSGAEQRGVPFARRSASRLARATLRALRPVPGVRDYTCGFRAYRADALGRVAERFGWPIVTRAGFECQVELLLRLHATGARFRELPFVLRYDQKHGASKMRMFHAAWGIVTVASRVPRAPRGHVTMD